MKGIDISIYQTNVSYQEVAKHVDFAILRCSYGEAEDPMFMTHVDGCRKAGIPIMGVYVFDYALDRQQAIAEADYACRICADAGLKGQETIIFFDCEGNSVEWAGKNGVDLDGATVRLHTRLFMDRCRMHGFKTGFYSNLDWMLNRYKGFELKEDEKFWFARYGYEPEFDYDFLQYTSSGKVPGINGLVDMNEFKEREAEEMALKKLNPNEWIKQHEGKIYDIDGVYGIQCVDLFKILLKDIGYPNPAGPIGGDGYADNIWYERSKYRDYFTFHQGEMKPGDIVIWAKGSPDCPSSHVAMYVKDDPANPARGIFFGSNQAYAHSPGVYQSLSMAGSLGSLRYKGWTDKVAADPDRGKLIPEVRRAKVKEGHSIRLRLGGPNGREIGMIKGGESILYDHKIVTNGHRYVVSGNLYMAVTPTEERKDYWADILAV